MENETNMSVDVTHGENMGNENMQGREAAKTFTQEEVNRIVQGRLEQMRKQVAKEQEAELSKKLQEVTAREMKVLIRERLAERNMPHKLADIITCMDEKELDNKLDALESIYGKKEDKPSFKIRGGKPIEGNTGLPAGPDPVRKAMGLE